eukprot:GDKI01024873.1.p1 GENE.GDKI01024873.1~~GDKI01024873.1.p1  ORF type:complete len:529 (-),score=93.60 GDKI01024873.1:25-1611(-)
MLAFACLALSVLAVLLEPFRKQQKIALISFVGMLYGVQMCFIMLYLLPFGETFMHEVHTPGEAREFLRGGRNIGVDPELANFLIDYPHINSVSVVVVAHNEHKYLQKTLDSIIDATPKSLLQEIVVVDDASEPPLKTLVEKYTQVKLVVNAKREGLIRSKITGADASQGDLLVFLDAHVKPEPGWILPLLRHTNENYKRVVVPVIPLLDEATWTTDKSAVGIKMMFDWSLEFNWFEDDDDLVPCMSGGLLAMTKRWWNESGKLDDGMQQWGGENIEQSVRTWLCGGEIYVARDSVVSHLFREKFPYALSYDHVLHNKIRAVDVWFGNWSSKFYDAYPPAKDATVRGGAGDMSARVALREKLQCRDFNWYVDKFRDVFMMKGLLPRETFVLKEQHTNKCLSSGDDGEGVVVKACDANSNAQRFYLDSKTGIKNIQTEKCLDATSPPDTLPPEGHTPILYPCMKDNPNQGGWRVSGGRLVWKNLCADVGREGTNGGKMLLQNCGFDPNDTGESKGIPRGQWFVVQDKKET